MPHAHRPIVALIAIAFLALTAVTFADVVGPGTTGGGDELAPPLPEAAPPADLPPSTTVVPEAPLVEGAGEVAEDLEGPGAKARGDEGEDDEGDGDEGKRGGNKGAKSKGGKGKPDKAAHRAWKARKKAAMAECKQLQGRDRGQCMSRAARAHRNPRARQK